ncbi:MAG: type II secretion system F family protein [Planctomycetes bacterium]|nr:type II secretion system F family protein [Planctomycetota bacterium]MCC7172841.1 type II secretion system F family protein [Planctomycetota bacterium]
MTQIELYRTIARFWRAGISPLVIGTNLTHGARDVLTRGVAAALSAGRSLAEAFAAHEALGIPRIHVRVVEAAERSGRIPETLDELARDAEAASALRRQTLAKVTYPLVVFHVAMFVMAPAAILSGNLGILLLPTCIAVVVDLALFAIYRALFFETSSPVVDRIALSTPILGSIRTSADVRGYLATTNHLYEAGIGLPDAFRVAATGLLRPLLRDRLRRALADLPPETDPFGHVAAAFPDHAFLASSLHAGFIAGDLSSAIRQIERPMAESEIDETRRFVTLVGGTLFTAAALLVAIIAIRFYGGLFAGLR